MINKTKAMQETKRERNGPREEKRRPRETDKNGRREEEKRIKKKRKKAKQKKEEEEERTREGKIINATHLFLRPLAIKVVGARECHEAPDRHCFGPGDLVSRCLLLRCHF